MSSDPAMLDSTDSLPATNSPHSDSPEQEGVGLAKWPQSRDHDRRCVKIIVCVAL